MTFATYITLFRLLCAVVILPLIYLDSDLGYRIAAGIFVCAIASDILDGFVARKFDQATVLGAKLDPLADKILIYSMLFSLMQADAISPALVFPMFIRDMIVDNFRDDTTSWSSIIGSNILGKVKFSFQLLSIMLSLSFCITGNVEIAIVANGALLVALLVGMPRVVVIALTFRQKSET